MLLSFFIAHACANFTGNRVQACSRAIEAATIQSSVATQVGSLEKGAIQAVYRGVASVTGEKAVVIVGVAAKVVRDRSLTYPIVRESSGMSPAVTLTVGLKNNSVNLAWRF